MFALSSSNAPGPEDRKPICAWTASCWISLFTDDVGIFANPSKEELNAISSILLALGDVSSLVTNLSKSEIFPICCHDMDLHDILSEFAAKIASFPRRYLGLPMHSRRFCNIDYQGLIGVTRSTGHAHLSRLGRWVSSMECASMWLKVRGW